MFLFDIHFLPSYPILTESGLNDINNSLASVDVGEDLAAA